MKFLFIFTLVLFSFSQSSFAGLSCYSAQEAEAEQGVRIHSELMVIGLNCTHMANINGKNLYLEHKKFTHDHQKLFSTYEKILMAYMKRNGVKNPDKAMHAMRTKFANKISNDVAKMRPDIFCRTYSGRIEKASKLTEMQLRKWAATPFESYPVSKPLCASN